MQSKIVEADFATAEIKVALVALGFKETVDNYFRRGIHCVERVWFEGNGTMSAEVVIVGSKGCKVVGRIQLVPSIALLMNFFDDCRAKASRSMRAGK